MAKIPELPVENLSILILSFIENTATCESSNELVNRLFANVQNSQTSNFLSNAPCYGEFGNSTSGPLIGISWEGTIAFVPYYLYRQTGRTQIIYDSFDAMLRYMDFLASFPMEEAPHLTSKTGVLADWLSVNMTNNGMVNNAVYVYLMRIIREMAEVIGEDEAAAKYAEEYELAKAEWNEQYVDPESGVVGQDTQTSYATPLRFGVLLEVNIGTAVENFVKTVEKAGYTLTTGFSAEGTMASYHATVPANTSATLYLPISLFLVFPVSKICTAWQRTFSCLAVFCATLHLACTGRMLMVS